jgi:hypothetical protein
MNRSKQHSGPAITMSIIFMLALALVAGRIAVVLSADGQTAFLSANDRSRWATVMSLVEHGTYSIDRITSFHDPVYRNRRPFDSIDKVRHIGSDGKQHYYSSKPPLLATIVAAVYAVIHAMTGLTMSEYPTYVPRIVLAVVNLPVMAILFWATGRAVETLVKHDWSRMWMAAAIGLGTMLTPMGHSLNNHVVAAASTALAMAIYVGAAQGPLSFGRAMLAGGAAAMAAANELPALSMTIGWGFLFALTQRRTLLPYLCGVAIVAAGFFSTNYISHQDFRMPYAHRGNGPLIAKLDDVTRADLKTMNSAESLPADFIARVKRLVGEGTVRVAASDEEGRWQLTVDERLFGIVVNDRSELELRQWDDWYEYPGSYWQEGRRAGVDKGEPDRGTYLLHLTVGHHGVFSLTPLWILVPLGWIFVAKSGRWKNVFHAFRNPKPDQLDDIHSSWLVLATIVVTLTCVAFYVSRPMIDRNYGGVSVCFRWLLWLAPMWFYSIATIVDSMARSKIGRVAMIVLLAASVISMSTALQTPWQSPWIYRYMDFLGLIEVG